MYGGSIRVSESKYLCRPILRPQKVATTDGVRNVLKQAYHDDDQVHTYTWGLTSAHAYTQTRGHTRKDTHIDSTSWLARERSADRRTTRIVDAYSHWLLVDHVLPNTRLLTCMYVCWMLGR
jgi:hypothetical protein